MHSMAWLRSDSECIQLLHDAQLLALTCTQTLTIDSLYRTCRMIVDKKDDPHVTFDIPIDSPPAYDDINTTSSKQPIASSSSGNATSYSRSPPHNSRTNRSSYTVSGNGSTIHSPSQKLHRPGASFSSRPRLDKIPLAALSPKAQSDVRDTVRGLVHDVVQGSSPVRSNSSAALGVLDSCAAACASHHLSLARILQERSIESHAPIYWAIVSRLPSNKDSSKAGNREDDTFLRALLVHAAPLAPVAVSELRAACLVASDNALFQRLRSAPGLIPLSGTDRVLLAGSNTQTLVHPGHPELEKRAVRQKSKEEVCGFGDVAKVLEGGAAPEAESFSVSLRLKMFQRRLRVSGELVVEFIARGRLWLLIFFVVPPCPSRSSTPSPLSHATPAIQASTTPPVSTVPEAVLDAARARALPPGTWAVALALLEGSPQCYADARLVVAVPSPEPDPSRTPSPLPGRSHHATSALSASNVDSNSRNAFRMADSARPPLPPKQSSAGSDPKPSRLSFFSRRTGSEDKNKVKTKPLIILNLTSSGSSPLLALPSPSSSHSSAFPGEHDISSSASKSKERRRPTRGEKRAVRAAAAKERRARAGRETRKERGERARMAKTVLLVGLEEAQASGTSGRKEESAKGGELMYDGCPYITPDGTLRAVIEARLSTSAPEANGSDCVIC